MRSYYPVKGSGSENLNLSIISMAVECWHEWLWLQDVGLTLKFSCNP